MKLQARLSLTTASTAILGLIVVLAASFLAATVALEQATHDKMLAILAARHLDIRQYLHNIESSMQTLAAAPATRESLLEFTEAYAQMGENAQYALQQRYVVANELERQERDHFLVTENPNAYDTIHNRQHERYRNRHRFEAMDDILLIDPAGNVVYSMLKEKEFATNLLKGPWKDTGLARALVPLLTQKPVPEVVSFADFSHYPPSNGLPMAFLALPVFDEGNQRFIGVIATKLPYTMLNRLLSDKIGLGESGDTVLINRDGWMLTDRRFDPESTALLKQVNRDTLHRVQAGEEGMIQTPDYRGIASYQLFKPLTPFADALGDKTWWSLLVKIDRAEVLQELTDQGQALVVIGGLLALLASLFSAWFARNIATPILSIQTAVTRLVHGEEVKVPELQRTDEIGAMAQAAESFRQLSLQTKRSHWLNEHLSELTNLVSSQVSMKDVPDAILKYLCDCLEVPVAALYFRDSQQSYSRVGIHGLARRSQAEDHFALGMGLVGQCARDREPIILSPVPEGLSVISAGLGEFSPCELVLYSISHKEEVLGVLELATLHCLTPYQHEFLTAATNGLGLHLANLQAAEHNLILLNETRQQAETMDEQRQSIEEASRYARSLIEASLDPLVTISVQGRIMDVNRATEKITGVSREELIGSDFSIYFTEPEQARIGYRQVFSQGQVIDYPLAIRHTAGKITDVLYNASVYYDAEGKVAGLFAAARDVTESKQQQEILQRNNEEMRAQRQRIEEASRYARSLIEASLDPLVTISTEGQIMDVNRATEKITGVSRDQLIGSDFCVYFTEPEHARIGYRQVFSQGQVIDYPLAIRHASGQITDVLYNASVYYDANGKVAGVFAAARDVTEAKQQQEELRQTNEEMKALTEELKAQNEEFRANQEELRAQQDEMQHKNQLLEAQRRELERARQEAETRARELGLANQYKSDFLANMSHELRTPLNSILILAKSLSENEDGNLTDDQVESAAVINESGTHLLTLINDILDLSKIEAGHFELFSEDFPLEEVMTYLRRTFMPLAEKKNIGFDIEVDSTAPKAIHGDRQRITQVLTNLLSNAIKFTDSGQVEIAVRGEDDQLRFDVTDTGIGIPDDKLESIFGVFQQADGSTSRKYGGSGLGLAISKRLTELMGGSISVLSAPGRGSTFSVKIPLSLAEERFTQPAKAVEKSKPAIGMPRRNGAPILLVEDDSRLVSILQRLIDTLGFPVATVESGEKALEFISHTRPAGLLLDLGLPGMQGMEVLRRLKAETRTADIPVFIMSGAQDTGEAKILGALGFLKKPVTKDSIAAAIRTMLEQATASAPQRTVLMIEDNAPDVFSLQRLFRHDDVAIQAVQTGKEALEWLSHHPADAIILDLQLPDISGFDWLQQLGDRAHPPIVVYSARELSSEELFQLRKHTDAVVTKGINNERLHQEVLRLLSGSSAMLANNTTASVNSSVSGDSRRLLLVDDDVRNLFALAKVLRQKGFKVDVAPSGVKALELLQQHSFDTVLCDIMMPEMDGYALIGHIRALGYGDLPLIAVTAKAMPGDVELCMQAGANDYIPKPVDINKLLEVLDRWL